MFLRSLLFEATFMFTNSLQTLIQLLNPLKDMISSPFPPTGMDPRQISTTVLQVPPSVHEHKYAAYTHAQSNMSS